MWILGQQLWNGAIAGMGYSLFAVGLSLIFGIMKVANMAHGEFYMLGAMITWAIIYFTGANFFLAFLLAIVLIGLIGIVFYQISLNPLIDAHPYSTMLSTMAVSYIIIYTIQVFFGVDSRFISTSIKGLNKICGISVSNSSLTLFILGIFVLFGVNYFLLKSKLGKMMRATSQSKFGAILVGIDIKKIYALATFLAVILAAVAGGIMGPIWVANSAMGQKMILKGFAVVVIGGMGNIKGAIVFGFFLGITEALFAQYVSMFYIDAYAFTIMILALLIKPEGFFPRD